MSREIELTRGMVAIVDDEDYARLGKNKWHAQPCGNRFYAARMASRKIGARRIYMHRELMGARPGDEIDHIDRDPLNNRRANLRLATGAQNRANTSLRSHNSTGFKGVSLDRRDGHYKAQITVSGENIYLGWFADPREAAMAYDAAALNHFGEFARTNQAIGLV